MEFTTTKCVGCDGYGTRPHRAKPRKFVTCRICKGTGIGTTIAVGDLLAPAYPTYPAFPAPVTLPDIQYGPGISIG